MSKDPSTGVGAVIIGPDAEVRSMGFNGFPRGIEDTAERLNDRDEKLKLVVHGELNAILNAARVGIPLKGCSMYIVAMNKLTGEQWGGPPCIRCTVEVIQAGITKIVSLPLKTAPVRWREDLEKSLLLLKEAGVDYVEVAA